MVKLSQEEWRRVKAALDRGRLCSRKDHTTENCDICKFAYRNMLTHPDSNGPWCFCPDHARKLGILW